MKNKFGKLIHADLTSYVECDAKPGTVYAHPLKAKLWAHTPTSTELLSSDWCFGAMTWKQRRGVFLTFAKLKNTSR